MRPLLPTDPSYAAAVEALVRRAAAIPPEVAATVREIVAAVRERGDAAVRELTRRFDPERPDGPLEVTPERWDTEAARVAPDVKNALVRAAERIRAFHERQREDGYVLEEPGVTLGLRVDPLIRVGVYVPGGTARYPSSVLMTAVPARVAGVRDIIMTTPGASPETLCAAKIAGVDRVFEIGGAQAVAALAYGTESVPRVDKIVGPGNIYVAAAKRQVFGDVDIDSIAGPSEVMVIADETADPRLVAADLLAQAEHDAEAHAVLVATSELVAARVLAEVDEQLASLPRRDIAAESLARHGAAIVVEDQAAALRLANRFAPEHLELHVRDPRHAASHVRTAGAIFLGAWSPEAAGDYLAGPSHVLPTGGAARYASPLGVYDFVKRTSIIEYTGAGLRAQAADISRLARVEGLAGHARSVAVRMERLAHAPPDDTEGK